MVSRCRNDLVAQNHAGTEVRRQPCISRGQTRIGGLVIYQVDWTRNTWRPVCTQENRITLPKHQWHCNKRADNFGTRPPSHALACAAIPTGLSSSRRAQRNGMIFHTPRSPPPIGYSNARETEHRHVNVMNVGRRTKRR